MADDKPQFSKTPWASPNNRQHLVCNFEVKIPTSYVHLPGRIGEITMRGGDPDLDALIEDEHYYMKHMNGGK